PSPPVTRTLRRANDLSRSMTVTELMSILCAWAETRVFLTHRQYDRSPRPARHLIDLDSYRYRIEGKRATSLIAQLGGPFGCRFCGGRQSPSLRLVRARTTASILGELEHLHATYGFEGFMFYDDELNLSGSFVELMRGICELQDRLGVSFFLRGFVK